MKQGGIIGRLLVKAYEQDRSLLFEVEAKELLRRLGLRTPAFKIAKSKRQACFEARKVGTPVVLKVLSPGVVHKSELGGVRLNLRTRGEIGKAYDEIMRSATRSIGDRRIYGVLVERMVPQGTELIVGATTDEKFGPIIVFGIGGIFVELYKDFSMRLIPITARDANEMLKEIRARDLLEGYRGQDRLDLDELVRILLAIGGRDGLMASFPSYVKAIDLNPVVVYPRGSLVVDGKFFLHQRKR
ncbi:MAG: acetate--CoA ligase family protein [Deltaproteobacteria bacterium]|nr:acetate--CoA ligase family protein [Deltaproteobacteria bacterium]